MDPKKENKKILICTGIYPPDEGGPATYSKLLKDKLPDNGMVSRLICYGEPENDDESKGIYRVSRKQSVFFRYYKYFRLVWHHSKWANLVYVQGPVSEGLPSFLALKLRRRPYVLKVVGDFAWEQARQRQGVNDLLDEFQDKRYTWRVELWRFVEKLVAKGAKQVVVPSFYLGSIVKKWGVANDKIEVIYNAIDLSAYEKNVDDIKRRLGINHRYIISSSRLVPWKGHDVLIEIMSELTEKWDDLHLLIAGSGPEEDNLKKKILDLGVDRKVELLGALEQKTLWDYMVASEALVLNTAYEGLSHLLVEAMNLGVPIITTRVGGNLELIENEKNGILVEYNDKAALKQAILDILNGKWDSSKLAKNNQERLAEFDVELMLAKITKLLKNT